MDALPHQKKNDHLSAENNRRSNQRVRLDAEVSLSSDSQFFTGLTRNVSTGGVFVATYRCLPLGCPVAMQLSLPDGDLVARGVVRWHREAAPDVPPGMGIAFEALDPTSFQRIARFCDARDPLLYEED
jgi:uncharacterized protein (TIGR02266 family)